jgi:hypothetical protein
MVVRRIGEAQSAVVGHRGEPDHVDAGLALLGPLDEHGGAGVAERERGQLAAHDRAHVAGRVGAELGDVLAAHDEGTADGAPAHPVVGDQHAGERAGARVGQIERGGARRPDGAGHRQAGRRLEPLHQAVAVLRDAAAHHQVHVLGAPARSGEAVPGGADGEGERVLVAHRHPPLVDAGEPLQVDVGAVAGRAHQLVGREVRGRERPPDPGDAGHVRRGGAVGRPLGEQPPGGGDGRARTVTAGRWIVTSTQDPHVTTVSAR